MQKVSERFTKGWGELHSRVSQNPVFSYYSNYGIDKYDVAVTIWPPCVAESSVTRFHHIGQTFWVGCVFWHFTIEPGCLQARDIRALSRYASEEEITMVPHTALRIEHKRPRSGSGETIHATVLRDAYNQSEDVPTILA